MLSHRDLQVVLFSATFPTEVVRFASKFAPNANEMRLPHEDLTVEGIKQIYLDCNGEQDKFDVLVKFYGLLTIGSSIIFVKVSTQHQLPPPSSRGDSPLSKLNSSLSRRVKRPRNWNNA